MRTAKKAIVAAVFALSGCGFAIATPQPRDDSPASGTVHPRPILSSEGSASPTASASVPRRPKSSSDVTAAATSLAKATGSVPAKVPPATDPVAILSSRSFKIPFNVDSAESHPVEVRLYVNRGGQSTWEHFDSKPPSTREFTFTSEEDGVFLFATQTLDSKGTAYPAGPIRPQLQVVVDTTGPLLSLEADGDSDGTVRGKLNIEDATAISDTRFYYASDVENKWQPLSITPVGDDRSFSFQPKEDWRQLSIHVTVVDAAGNQTVTMKRLHRPRLASLATNRFAANTIAGEHKQPVPETGTVPSENVREQPYLDATHRNRFEARPVRFRTDATTESTTTELYIHPAENHPEDASNPVIKLDRKKSEVSPDPGHLSVATNFGSYRKDVQMNQLRGDTLHGQTQRAIAQSPLTGVPPRNAIAIPPRQAIPPASAIPPMSFIPPSNAAGQASGMPPRQITTPPSLQSDSGLTTLHPNATGQVVGQIGNPSFVPRYAQRQGMIELPPPATPEQVSSGFGPLAPTGSRGPALFAPTTGSPATPPTTSSAGPFSMPSNMPSTQPAANPETTSPQPTRPRTLAEAMRPLDSNARPKRPAEPERRAASAPMNRPPVNSAPAQTSPATTNSAPSATPETDRYSARRALESRIDAATFGGRIPTRFSDSNRFSLEYELEAVGMVGVESVELYGSTDGGKSWKFWGQDPDKASPFDIETKEEGVFGFRIVVVSSNGLASPRPQASESPDIVVVVDQSKPEVRITGAQYGEADRTGSLVIRYECDDANLATRPITLSFSNEVDGPWTTIAAGLRNDGDYVWPADPQLPRELYLRIDATDNAGNMGSYILDQPIDTQGLAPRARIRGFQPISGFPMPTKNEQTAARPNAAFK